MLTEGHKRLDGDYIAWINLVKHDRLHCTNLRSRLEQKSYIPTCSTHVTAPGLSPELKSLENIRFYECLLRARLWEHDLYSVRSIAFISTVVKSPDEAWTIYKELCTHFMWCRYIGGRLSNAILMWCKSTAFVSCHITGKPILIFQWYLSGVVFTFTKFSHVRFENWVNFEKCQFCKMHVRIYGSNLGPFEFITSTKERKKLPGEDRGGDLSGAGMIVNFLLQVAPNTIYVVCCLDTDWSVLFDFRKPFVELFSYYPPPAYPLPLGPTGISRKGRFGP